MLRPAGADLARSSRDFREKVERMVRDWQGGVLDLVRTEGGDKRATARFLAYGVNGLGVVLMVVVFASTGGLTGAEVGIAGGTAVLGQKRARGGLRRPGRTPAGRTPRARTCSHRVETLMDAERGALRSRCSTRRSCRPDTTDRLRTLARRVDDLRFGRGLVSGLAPARRRLLGSRRAAGRARRGPGRRPSRPAWAPRRRRRRPGRRGRRPRRCPAEPVRRAHRGRAGRRDRVGQVLDLFNALCGLDVAAVGVRRPTTSWATACVWGEEPADALLSWLDIPPRHRVTRESALDAGREHQGLDGLVLLDLPDHDSTEVNHHLEVDRLVAMVDVMVWVLDPQKYADAAMHRRFLAPLAGHHDVMLVVLNQVDRCRPAGASRCWPTCAGCSRPTGSPTCRCWRPRPAPARASRSCARTLAHRVADKAASRARLAADVSAAAGEMARHSGDAEPRELGQRDQRELVDALADAAGVPVVVDAVRRATTVRARRATGWPLTAWVSRLKPDPLRRLHLDRGTTGHDVVSAARSSIPAAYQVQRARVETTVRDLCDDVSQGLAQPWVRSVAPGLDLALRRPRGRPRPGRHRRRPRQRGASGLDPCRAARAVGAARSPRSPVRSGSACSR